MADHPGDALGIESPIRTERRDDQRPKLCVDLECVFDRRRRGRAWRPSWLPWVSGRHVRARWFQKDLAAIHVSAGEGYRDALLEALLPEYLRLRGLPPEALGPWDRAVRRRSARMAARVPRVTDPETREGDAVEREVDDRFLPRS